MRNWILFTSLIGILWTELIFAQPSKFSPAPSMALAKAFRPNASKMENLEAIRHTLGISPYPNLQWIASTTGVDTFRVVDDFNRATIGSDWAIDDQYWKIVDGELTLTALANMEWRYLAIYKPVYNDVERHIYSVSYRWGKKVDALGIREGAMALMIDDPSPRGSGYWLWHRYHGVWLWIIKNGGWEYTPGEGKEVDRQPGLHDPGPGDVVTGIVRNEVEAVYFDYYKNGELSATVKDYTREFPKGETWFVGLFLHGQELNNQVDDFTVTWLEGDGFPPATVRDLTVTRVTHSTVSLAWTAPGDNGLEGRATRYDIRYSTNRILTDTDFDRAVPIPETVTPGEGGGTDSVTLTGLNQGTYYYFAIKAYDEVNNVSALSNEASAKTTTLLPYRDSFNRADGNLGSAWAGDLTNMQIRSGAVQNLSNLGSVWSPVIYQSCQNAVEVTIDYGLSASVNGISGSGILLMADAPSASVNGYLIQRDCGKVVSNPDDDITRLWLVRNGRLERVIDEGASQSRKIARGGSRVTVSVVDIDAVRYIYVYVDGVFDRVLADPLRTQYGLYAGLMLESGWGQQNAIDEFSVYAVPGGAKIMTKVSGDHQFGAINQTLPFPLTVAVGDSFNNPLAGVFVRFVVTSGAATVPPLPSADGNLRIEAEDAVITSPMEIRSDAKAAAGKYVVYPANGTEDASATLAFDIAQAGTYYVWTRSLKVGPPGSWTISVDGGADFVYDVFQNRSNSTWTWDLLSERGNGTAAAPQFDPRPFKFTAGTHTLEFKARYAETKLDQIIVTADRDFVPSDNEESGFLTDIHGQASANVRLGSKIGPITVEARYGKLAPVIFTATAISNEKPERITAVSGGGQSGPAGQQLQPFKVALKDKNGNGIAGQLVTWVVTAGNGTLSNYTSTSDLNGNASTTLILGNISPNNTVEARAAVPTGSPVVFTATTTSGLAASLLTVAGNSQAGTVHAALPNPLVTKVVTSTGQAVANFPLDFEVARGGGTLSPSISIKNGGFEATIGSSNTPALWNLEGSPSASEVSLSTNGPHTGTKCLQVNSPRSGVGVLQTLNYPAAGGYFTLSFWVKVISGTAQVSWWTTDLSGNTSSKVIDITPIATGNAWTPYTISFYFKDDIPAHRNLSFKTIGGTGGNFLIDDVKIALNTGSNGQVALNWTLGDTAMTQVVRVEAKVGNTTLAGSPLTFAAIANPGPAKKLVLVDGDNQYGSAGQSLNRPLIIRVMDEYGNGIANHSVKYTVKSGDGKINGTLSSFTTKTDGKGYSQATLSFGPSARDTVKVEVSATGLKSVNFNAVVAVPSKVIKVAGAATTGSAGHKLASPLVVRVTDASGRRISNYPVIFNVRQGNGSINGATQAVVPTDTAGEAKAYPVLGPTPGATNKIEAWVSYNGKTLPSPVLSFIVRARGLKELIVISGNNQTGNSCEPLPQPFKVKVVDSLGVGIKGQTVTFTVKSGGGKFNGFDTARVITDSSGIAQSKLTLGPKPGVNEALAKTTVTLAGSPQTFTATGLLGAASELRKLAGDSLTAQVNTILPSPVRVRVTDKCGNGIANVNVRFVVKAGAGKVNGKDTVTVTSDAEGTAQVSWRLGSIAGKYNNKVEVQVFSTTKTLTISPLIFVASATASAARSLTMRAGNGQNGRAGEILPNPLIAKVTDGAGGTGNAVSGHRVRFVVVRGGGNFSTGSKDTTVFTDANGEAKVIWTLGGAIGTNSQEVRAAAANSSGGSLENSPLIFLASATGGPPSAEGSLIEATGPVPADGVAKSKVTVYVRDRFGNPVPRVGVTLVVSGSGLNVIDQPKSLTDSLGRATGAFSSTRAELKMVTAQILGGIALTRGATVQFLPTAAANIDLVSGSNQVCNIRAALPKPLSVKVGDKYKNGVPGHEVRFVVKGDGRILEANPIKTDANGIANANFIAGTTTGQQQIWAEAPGLTNSPVIFLTTVVNTPAHRIQESSGNGQRGKVNTILPQPLVVRVSDAYGRPVFGTTVKIEVTFGEGSIEGRKSLIANSNELGEISVSWRLGPEAGLNTIRFEATGLAGSPIDFRAESVPDEAAVMKIVNCGNVIGPAGGTTVQPLRVQVTDASGNGVDSVQVLFELLQGTGSFSSRDQVRVMHVVTKSGGFAEVPITFGNESGWRRVRVSAEGLAGSPAICSAYARALSAQTMEIIPRTNNQRGTKGKPLNFPLQVLVKDRLGNPVPNEAINFLIIAGSGDFNGGTPYVAKTDSHGIASAPWTLGKSLSANEAMAVNNNLFPSVITFKATGFDNNFPIFVDVPDRRVTEGDVVEFQLSASDADGDPLTYSAPALPFGARFDSLVTRVFRWATNLSSAGHHEVSFFVRDNKGGIDEEVVVIDVQNRNQMPIIYSRIPKGNIPNKADTVLNPVAGQGSVLMRVDATDPDDDVLSYRWFVNGKYAGSATNTFFFRSADRFSAVEAWVFDQEDTARTRWVIQVPVQLSSFTATLETNAATGGKQVSLRWSTASASSHVGFNVMRSRNKNGEYEKINSRLIPFRGDGQYEFVDTRVEAGVRYFYKLQEIDLQGNVTEHGSVTIEVTTPQSYGLQQNYPNPFGRLPFNPVTQIRYELPRPGYVRLIIYNALGQEIRRLVEQRQSAGYYQVIWNGRDQNGKPVPSGVYHYRLQVKSFSSDGDYVATRKMLMTK
ncbi:MAG: Ig-like domain-containing protein [candidate division KSB1 bacterium]|nr:Ig-like domain-containing protein [candidate division KSB1 bacterium]MDZ7311178.1 Ig-like domain-containing protein [candidate division KSB1 bacterium]